MRSFIESSLGNGVLSNASVASQYTELIAELRRIAGLASEIGCIQEGAQKIKEAGAPRLAARVRTVPISSVGDDETLPVTWREAWNWARMREHLDRIEGRAELRSLGERRRDLEAGLSRFYREMVAKSAWLATKRNTTPRILQALAGYAIAVRKIGQGTGPNATRYRRDARQAMFDAAGAVPCWVMNHTRISEAMPPEIGMFDLVIVDEASQSDLWALPAILRGKKILVVGDDKQVSPDGGFIDSGRIQELRQRFLSKQPYAAEMTPEKSLYDLSARVFAATQIMLREHFRCVPPIIAYSNRTFYKGQIQPLRIPRASERIEPPLVDIYVEGGTRDAHDCNHREAEAIADEINAILAWVFWRCFASTWVLRKDEVMEELVEFLDRMGIEPLGAIETVSRIVEKRVFKPESDALDLQSANANGADACDGAPSAARLELEIKESGVEYSRISEAVSAVSSSRDGNVAKLSASESTKRQLFQKGEIVTYRTNKGKRRNGVITWTDGKQVKLIDNGATVSKNVDDILAVSSIESNLFH